MPLSLASQTSCGKGESIRRPQITRVHHTPSPNAYITPPYLLLDIAGFKDDVNVKSISNGLPVPHLSLRGLSGTWNLDVPADQFAHSGFRTTVGLGYRIWYGI